MSNQKIKCLEYGECYVKPLAHVWQKHGLSAREYKKKHGLDLKKGITTDDHRELLRKNIIADKNKHVIVNLTKNGEKSRFKKGDERAGKYKRSQQTQTRLKTQLIGIIGRPKGTIITPKIEIKCATCGKPKMIYPRHYQENNNYCGPSCRNIANNRKRHDRTKEI